MNRRVIIFAILPLAFLSGCATQTATTETLPEVKFLTNDSGIIIGDFKSHGPKYLLGGIPYRNGQPAPYDVPTGVWARAQRLESLHNTEPRYFIPASGSIQVVSIERPAAYNTPYKNFEAELKQWKWLIKSAPLGPETQAYLNQQQLSEIPWTNAGSCFYAKLRRQSFPWGNALLYLTSYVQGNTGGPVNNDMLVLVLQGITKDDRYAVNAHMEIRHPGLPDSLWDKRMEGLAVFSIDDQTKEAEKWLDAQPDDSFRPTTRQYEEFFDALRVRRGAPYVPASAGRDTQNAR
ncbi:MAG: hypothetical protein H0W66_02540 [Chthoniobacterales bacterium]|nr:hypothetical protein [Chthoniobacterales bacterium]